MTDIKKTTLNAVHKALGARMVPFAGWEMPVQYSGVIDEHRAVREAAGLFDVSHMGEIDIKGPHALDFVQLVTTNDASRLEIGQAQYSLICYPTGGIVDDTIVYRMGDYHYMLCVNASNAEKDYSWLKGQLSGGHDAQVTNVSDSYSQIALQGPKAMDIINSLCGRDLREIPGFCFDFAEIAGTEAMVSRTGYTGEDGVELYLAPDDAPRLWEAIMDAGRDEGIKPAGLGARDTLRLEMKYSLYGNDIDAGTTALEAKLDWVVKFDKADFIGREALLKQKDEGAAKKLSCFVVEGRGIPRHAYEIHIDGRKVGNVTSGTMSPSMGTGIAMGYIEAEFDKAGQEVDIIIRGKAVAAKVVAPPFYKK